MVYFLWLIVLLLILAIFMVLIVAFLPENGYKRILEILKIFKP
jgi:hypothetical protein